MKGHGLFESTTIIVTAKHGQSPVDPNRFFPIPGHSGQNGAAPSGLIAAYLPDSETHQIGPTEDDISLLWLTNSDDTLTAVGVLEDHAADAQIGQIFYGPSLEIIRSGRAPVRARPADPVNDVGRC